MYVGSIPARASKLFGSLYVAITFSIVIRRPPYTVTHTLPITLIAYLSVTAQIGKTQTHQWWKLLNWSKIFQITKIVDKIYCILIDSLLYSSLASKLVPGSSAVEQAAVNRLAGGSNPSRGAKPHFYFPLSHCF